MYLEVAYVPMRATMESHRKAFFYSFISGLLAFAAGVRVAISLDDLLLVVRSFAKAHIVICIGAGMVVMDLSLIVLNG